MKKMTALLAAFTVSIAGCWSEQATIKSDKTNVLLIIMDTTRADHLGTYGYEINTSPVVDQLAETGVTFEQYFSTSS